MGSHAANGVPRVMTFGSLSASRWMAAFTFAAFLSCSVAFCDSYTPRNPSPFGPDWRAQDDWSYPRDPMQGWPFGQAPETYPPNRYQRHSHTPEPHIAPRHEEAKPRPDPAERLKKALAPPPDPNVQREQALKNLQDRLQAAQDADEAKGLAGLIQEIWLRSPSPTANLLIRRAGAASLAKDFSSAEDILDRLVLLQPNWAEAHNQRAQLRFLTGNFQGAMIDIDETLRLEPRHFGAMTTMGLILEQTGFEAQALTIFRKSLTVYPHQPAVEALVKKLTLAVEGRDI